MSDQPTQPQVEPIELLRRKAGNVSTALDSLRSKASIGDVLSSLDDIDSQLGALPGQIAQVRRRGYVFSSHWESDVAALQAEWPAARARVQANADEQRRLLSPQVDDLQTRFSEARLLIDADMGQAGAALNAIAAAVENLSKKADTAIQSIRNMYDTLRTRLDTVQSSIRRIENVLKRVDEATFKLYPEENVVDVIDAQWLTDQKSGPKGMLFCTDHRLIFEQNEEVATKKVLFIVTEKQKVQQVAMEAPIGSVQQVKESDTGALLFHKDHLELTFGAESKVRAAHFILKGDSALWQRLINRVNAGEMEKDRVGKEAAPAADKPKTMPSQCPTCGARFTQEIVRGMNSVKCKFCGTVIQL